MKFEILQDFREYVGTRVHGHHRYEPSSTQVGLSEASKKPPNCRGVEGISFASLRRYKVPQEHHTSHHRNQPWVPVSETPSASKTLHLQRLEARDSMLRGYHPRQEGKCSATCCTDSSNPTDGAGEKPIWKNLSGMIHSNGIHWSHEETHD